MGNFMQNIRLKVKNSMGYKLLLFMLVVVAINLIASIAFFRIDLTSDKRHSISPQSKQILSTLKDYVNVTVYLDGEMPIGFKKMERSLKDMLYEFQVYGGSNFRFNFVNPSESSDPKERDDVYKSIYQRGVLPVNIHQKDVEGGSTEKIVFPGAVVNYRGKEMPVNFLTNVPGLSGEENLNRSEQNLEYNIINAIEKMSLDSLPKIAFIEGHGELEEAQVGDIARDLSGYYSLSRVTINGNPQALNGYRLAVVAGGTKPWPEVDKLVLDQFIMKGGRVAFFIDPVTVSEDSLSRGSMTVAMVNNLNLEDMLFTYGIRVNSVLLQDMQCAMIPVNVSLVGEQPNFVPAPWYYYPLFVPSNASAITRNLNLVEGKFCSTLDTLSGESKVTKSVLLASSPYSRTLTAPLIVSLEQIRNSPLKYEFNQKHLIVAVLEEGQFKSDFRNRMDSEYLGANTIQMKDSSLNTKIAVVADADIIRNEVKVRPDGVSITPLGYDKYTNQTYGNKDFVRNLVSYLTDEHNLISLRNRDLKLRLLDRNKVLSERTKWQLINVVLPSVIVMLFGLLFIYFRRKKYAKR
ncbi:MAG TPA: gliding motility-associated ABC transporter substrate-binding protein GldG [Williamwhitmania sp.]|nr:gliding motility-associated ABC transporter substrate-binding protein GldG [Williamwhitmania sp.]